MHEHVPNPAVNPAAHAAQVHEIAGVLPQKFEPGIYVSRAPLPTAEEETRTVEAYKPEQTVRAIGMAALPKEYRDQQMTSLVYNGMTSEDYSNRHKAFLAEVAAHEQQSREAVRSLEQAMLDDDEAGDEAGTHKKSDRLVGAKR